jgi:hypothetical protein
MKYNFASGDPIGLPGLRLSRRDSLKVTAAGAMASLLPIAAQAAAPAKASSSKSKKDSAVTNSAAIRPFHYEASKGELTDLKKRVTSTKWPDREQVPGETQGVQLATMQKLAHYWETKHDWRKCEAKIFAHPHFLTEIDGLDIHFIHVRSRHEHALPIIITHGWPGSIIEQLKIIEPLTNPTAHGGVEADEFDAGLRLLRQANQARMEPCHNREGVGDADAAPRLHEICGAGRRLGQCDFGGDGAAAAAGIARHSHQHGGNGAARYFEGALRRRPGTGRTFA